MSRFTDRLSARPTGRLPLRRLIIGGTLGLLLVLAITPIRDAWDVNRAGIAVNRALVARSSAGEGGAADSASPPATKADLQQAMRLLMAAANRHPQNGSREVPIWRTFGAAAALAPSEEAFTLLSGCQQAGWLDRIGQLWLGEVASATDHWDEAVKAYQQIDASNLLISRGDQYLEAGDKGRAVWQYDLAKISMDAALERERRGTSIVTSADDGSASHASLMSLSTERVTALYRIGRGLLAADQPQSAVPVLEAALTKAESASPGAVVKQSLRLNLARALALTLPEPPAPSSAVDHYSDYPNPELMAYVESLIRIRGLVFQAMDSDVTGGVCLQAGRVLLLIRDEEGGVAFLRQAIKMDPLLPDAYLALGAWYESKGMKILPRELYQQATELLPANDEIAVAWAIASYNSLTPSDALPRLKQVAQTDTKDPYLFACLGDCYLQIGMETTAMAAYEEGLRRSPGAAPLTDRLKALEGRLRSAG
jgi:tetratricopeptide (TPR) repeat protein